MLQLLSNAYLRIYEAAYIRGEGWWLKNGENWWNRTTRFTCDILYLARMGEFDLRIAGEWHHIRPGMMVYVPMDTELEYYFDGNGPLEKFYTHFDVMLSQHYLRDYFRLPYVTTLQDPEKAAALFAELNRLYAQNTFEAGLAANGLLLQLVQLYLRESGAEFTWNDSHLDGTMGRAVAYIRENAARNITVGELAERAGYSTGHFSKKFKETFGCTPQAYIADLKLEEAKKRLRHTDQPISAIAEELGFCDVSYFGNFFKAKTGVFPSHYRKFRSV